MIKDEAYKRFLKSSEEINEILFTMDLDKIKPSNSALKLNLKLLELVNEQKNLIKEVEEAILKGKNQELKDYISFLLENLEKQKDKAQSKINSSEKFYPEKLYGIIMFFDSFLEIWQRESFTTSCPFTFLL